MIAKARKYESTKTDIGSYYFEFSHFRAFVIPILANANVIRGNYWRFSSVLSDLRASA
jgi:hypothetical protein